MKNNGLSNYSFRILIGCILLPLISVSLTAQTVLDTNPPSIKWSQVNTPYFRVVFPRGLDAEGIRVANTLEYIREKESRTLGTKPRLITVLLQNQTAESNGFVSIQPRRSEFFTMPSQDYNFGGTNDWLDLLSSHEFRHIAQYQHATRGFNRVFYYAFGSTTMAAFAHLAVPSWFWEGDAVATETAFTRSGRGKIPNFSLVFKTNLLEGRTFNYHKQWLRSYKHNIPDHYVLGYHMVSYLRKKTNNPEVWGQITARSWNFPFLPFVFSRSIKQKSGLNVSKLYNEMASDMKKQWQQQLDSTTLTSFEPVRLSRKGYTDFNFPHQLSDGSVVVMKTGIGEVTHFAFADSEQKRIFTPGFINDSGMISAAGSTIVWNEYGYDPRWTMRNYSLIKSYDLKTRKKRIIGGKKSRYTSAAISADESKIVAARTEKDYKTQLVILSYPEGKILSELENTDNSFYSMARWSETGDRIVALKTNGKGRTIVVIDANSGLETEVLAYDNENMGYPVLFGNYILFNSPVSGIDNIYAYDLNMKVRYQITSSKYGAYNPSVSADGKSIFYNEQTKEGLDVVKVPFEPGSWTASSDRSEVDALYKHLVQQEGSSNLLAESPQTKLPVTRFSKSAGLFNPYNWGFFVDNTFTRGNIGINSQDLLSTTSIEAGYRFNVFERTSSLYGTVSYQGWYPVVDLTVSQSNRRVIESTDDFNFEFKWAEKAIEGGLRVPLVLTSSRFAERLSVGSHVGLTQVTKFRNSVDGTPGRVIDDLYYFYDYAGNGNLLYNKSNLNYSRLLKRSRRDINSKWGQRLELAYYNTLDQSDYFGSLVAANGVLYFPGLFRHHSVWGYAAFQKREITTEHDDLYIFQNEIPLPRGFILPSFSYFYSYSANYTLPIFYPDLAIGPIVNVQRLRANVFYDFGYGDNPELYISRIYNSVGIEGKLDLNLFRLLQQVEVGGRFSYGIHPSVRNFEFLVGVVGL